jgi:hypothetical protein
LVPQVRARLLGANLGAAGDVILKENERMPELQNVTKPLPLQNQQPTI